MIKVDVNVKTNRLPRFKDEFRKGLEEGMRKAMFLAERKSKERMGTPGNLNIKTGNLRRSINSSVTVEGNSIVGRLGSYVVYSRIHELGGVIRARDGYLKFKTQGGWRSVKQVVMPKRPFLRPAINDNMTDMLDIIIKTIIDKVEGR